MNHYERLKVSQDAPAEVIRAAYRALAAKLHPDRQSGAAPGGPDDGTHSEMAALNAAYEVLIDPKLRREYDATLLAPSRSVGSLFGVAEPAVGSGTAATDFNSTRVDLNWMPPGVASTAKPIWPPSRRTMLVAGSGLAVVIIATAGVMWQVMGQHKMEKVISTQYSGPGASGVTMPPPAGMPPEMAAAQARREAATGARRPSVEELASMSDEELLKVLPTLDEDAPLPPEITARASARSSALPPSNGKRHLLDGQPLGLRTELTLVDPLAAETGKANKR